MATCKDCVHVEVCCSLLSTAYNKCKLATPDFELLKNIECDECEHFKAHSRFVELPCKIGDTVYSIYKGDIEAHIVNRLEFCTVGNNSECQDYFGTAEGIDNCDENFSFINFTKATFGKTVFLAREEAERALSKRTQKKENEFYRGHCVSDDGKFCKHIKAAKGDNLSNDNTMSCEYGEVNCPYAKPLEEVNAK